MSGQGTMRLGYIQEYKDSNERFRFKEAPFTRRISSKSDKITCKLFYGSIDYDEIVSNANIMKKNPKIILVREPFLLDDALREKVTRWISWANQADPSEFDPFENEKSTDCE